MQILENKNHFDCQEFDDFLIEEVYLEKVLVKPDEIWFRYLLDGEEIDCSIKYDSISLEDKNLGYSSQVQCWAVIIAVLSILRFSSVVPQKLDFSKYSQFIDKELLDFLKNIIPKCWSEKRYQVGKLAFQSPEIKVNESVLGQDITYPIFKLKTEQGAVDAIIGSGSGKDSLLCSLILQKAGINYDILTCLYNVYGDLEEQKELFTQASQHLNYRKQHYIYFQDFYYPWLEQRVNNFNISARTQDYFEYKKLFGTAATGECIVLPFILAPIQAIHKIPLLLVGHEKSADAHNLIDKHSGEAVRHQWEKSLEGSEKTEEQMARLFTNINHTSLIKAIHDVKIFELVFKLGDQLPYATNSCNIQKPWCCRCEKCCYVFAGFCAYGDREKVIKAFGKDLFTMEENLDIWSELLGLKGYIPWECVGMNEETQLYFYKLYQQGVTNQAMDLFEREILTPLQNSGKSVENYFQQIQNQFGKVYEDHHTIPEWLWKKISPVLG
ncbi:MAG: hypothetical protein F6K63_17760 [Moorea sp. SIO1G6]|uniref:hypothetical protein n=1 Tax=Moorena sp. SIO1G6 TaxID=2607840 RepID=UPI0013BF2418|nr:hypothetical protein [Moorena sp. SIO1G6]NES85534.1 hypothetical protein [Moorena sp. SIO2B7]NET66131.1 hypothetical protein [Moorena sp. SIO1G6]